MVLFVGHFAVVGKREGERAMTDADVDADTLFSVPCPLGKIRREMMKMPLAVFATNHFSVVAIQNGVDVEVDK